MKKHLIHNNNTMQDGALFVVGDHVSYDLDDYEVIGSRRNQFGGWEYDLKPLTYDLLGISEEELESI